MTWTAILSEEKEMELNGFPFNWFLAIQEPIIYAINCLLLIAYAIIIHTVALLNLQCLCCTFKMLMSLTVFSSLSKFLEVPNPPTRRVANYHLLMLLLLT